MMRPAVDLVPFVFFLDSQAVLKNKGTACEIAQPKDAGQAVIPISMSLALNIAV